MNKQVKDYVNLNQPLIKNLLFLFLPLLFKLIQDNVEVMDPNTQHMRAYT